MSTIVELQAQNFKRLKAITIRPDGSTVLLGGRNAQGKSSTLDAIMAALGGGRMLPEEPIRHGEKKASIRLELDDLVIVRKFTKSGSQLTVTKKDGSKVKKPQQVLDALTGALSFDPLAFTRQSAKEQEETLRRLAGLDLSAVDAEIAQLFEERRDANRDATRLQGAADSAPMHKGVGIDPIVISDLVAEVSRRQAHNDKRRELEKKQATAERELLDLKADAKRDVEIAESRATVLDAEIVTLEQKLKDKREEHAATLEAIQGRKDAAEKEQAEKQAEIETLAERFRMGHWEDLEEVQAKIAGAEETNTKIRENVEAGKKRKEAAEAKAVADKLTEKLEEARERRRKMIEAASFPVDGLSIDEDGVSFNGVAFSQASGAEKIRVSASIGLAMNPELRILLIRDASLLDDSALAELEKLAAENNAQIWLERVGDQDQCGIIIEDGEIIEGEAV